MATNSADDRFWSKVSIPADVVTGCWLWTAYLMPKGYGQCSWGGRMRLTHRIAFAAVNGPIPDGLQLDHLCRNRACVNPAHLEPVTNKENVRRGRSGKHGNHARGECHGVSKLTSERARQIRESHSAGVSMRRLSVEHGVSERQVSNVIHRRTWRHV